MGVSRRRAVHGIVTGGLVVMAGCVNLEGYDGGVLSLLKYPTSPEGASVIDATNQAIDSLPVLQEGLERVADEGAVDIDLTSDEYDAVDSRLSELPYYDRRNHDGSDYSSGYYVGQSEYVVCVSSLPYCSDTPGITSRKGESNECWDPETRPE